MRLAVISDIHGNTDAFVRVLADADLSCVDEMVCLGDVIGYGPEPNEAIRLIRERNIPTVMGNHELGVVRRDYLNLLNPIACQSLLITIKMLSGESLNFVNGLETSLVSYNSRFVHGFPPDSPTIYMFEPDEEGMCGAFGKYGERLCFAGHTHGLEFIEYDGNSVFCSHLKKGPTTLCRDKRYIINAGSVGQPRDGDNHAKYLIWDTSNDTIEVKYIPYDIDSVVNKIIRAGLPEFNARRLM
jgi:predicted phosphodiesterase